uniref:Acetylornithine/succinyldiaminopimelate aminotransferase (ACOAT) (DapATase) (Succinyldiaminopimelate transferase) ) n=1 Tax=Ganoderma boninense TaxID=34458 RepID=A0A5K1JUK9_9APHY|nr:Acetylornithine/succinyldiaminopimelate aminotransferase (ACOAT) (DapATase) (Succinyldiaminopimelate transferase) (EC (EC [Ganoderma boninense]
MAVDSQTFAKYKALVFDCYGTLIDWETGIYDSLRPLFQKSGQPADRKAVIVAFSAVERDLQAQYPTMLYSDLLAKVYTTLEARLQNKEAPPSALRDDTSAETTVVSSQGGEGTSSVGTSAAAQEEGTSEPEAFAESVERWPPFPDTIGALTALSKRFKLVILSNIDRTTIAKTRKLMEGPGGFEFDGVYTAEEVGAYKPAPEMLGYALARLKEKFKIEPDEVLMTAQSVFHDIVPAKGRGIATAWINREGAITGLDSMVQGEEAMFVFPTLGAMAEAVEQSSG